MTNPITTTPQEQEQVKKLLALMEVFGVNEEKVKGIATEISTKIVKKEVSEAIKNLAPVYKSITISTPMEKKAELKDVIVPSVFEKTLQLASMRKNILLVGPAGCGKTHLAELIAKSLNLPFGCISLSGGVSESHFTGWLLPIGEGGRFSHVMSPFGTAYENGGVFLLDEIDAADPNTMCIINAALANEHFTVNNRPDNPQIKKHKDFICIAAANTFGNGADRMYVGRNQLDAATLDRFRCGTINMNYDSAVEKAIVDSSILDWAIPLRAKIESIKLRRLISTRFLNDLTQMQLAYPNEKSWNSPNGWFTALTQDWSKDEVSKIRG